MRAFSVTGLELTPGAQVTARLTAPGGRVSRESVQVDGEGRFRLELTLPTGGRYQLTVRGPGAERTWQLTVPKPQPKPPATLPKQPEGQNTGQNTGQNIGQNTGQSLTPPAETTATLEVTRSENGVSATRGSRATMDLDVSSRERPDDAATGADYRLSASALSRTRQQRA